MNTIDPHTYLKEKLYTDDFYKDGRSLYNHLSNVEQILRICRCDEDVCLAALYHSVYGTSTLTYVSTTDREKIRNIIGTRAEHLVWIFSTAKRPYCWLFGENIPLMDGSFIRIDKKTLHDLHMIEAANLLEQKGGLVEILSFTSRQDPLNNSAESS